MPKMYKYRFLLRLMVVLLASGFVFQAVQAVAQSRTEEWQSVAVFSMISTDDGAPLIKQAFAAMNHPDLLDDFEQAQREAFATLDFSKPKGIVCQTNGRSFRLLAFAAMKDVAALPYGIGDLFADIEPNRDGWYKMPFPNANQMPIVYQSVYVKQQGDWAYACYGIASPPKELPPDPTVLLDGLPEEYPVALRFNFAALPKSLVNGYAALGKMSLSMLKTFLPMMEPDRKDRLASFDFITVVASEAIDQLAKFANETETLTIGLNGNAANDLTITCRLVAKPDTDTAKAIEAIGDCTTDLIGFYRPDEALYTEIYAYPIAEYEKSFYKNILTAADELLEVIIDFARANRETYSDADEMEFFDTLLAPTKTIFSVLQQTVDGGIIDCADFVTADMTYVAALKIAGGNALVKPINKLYDFAHLKMAELLIDFGVENEVVWERENYKDFQFWKVTVPVPLFSFDDERQLPGSLTYIIGVRDDMFVFAYGMSPTTLDTLKKAIDESGKPVPVPREIVVCSPDRLGQIFKTLGIDLIADENDEGEVVMDIVNSIPENAKVVVTQDVEANVLTWTWVSDGKLWPTIGKFLDAYLNLQLTL